MSTILKQLFSLRNSPNQKHKIITILGIKIKIKIKNINKAIVLVGPLAIGDYYFISPFFNYIKQSDKYKNHKIIYFAHDSFIDFAKVYNQNDIDEFYSLSKILNNKNYKKFVFKELKNKYTITTIVKLNYLELGRKNFNQEIENLISKMNADEKIMNVLELSNDKIPKEMSFYTKIIYSPKKYLFENERQKHFFENWLNLNIKNSQFTLNENYYLDNEYILISGLAGNKLRMLNIEKWIDVINYILKKTNLKIVLIGSYSAVNYNNEIIQKSIAPERCFNLAGQTTLSSLPYILKKSKLLLSVETSTVHLAQSINIPTICVSNGAYYKRFHPYNNCKYIYPKNFVKDVIQSDMYKWQSYVGVEYYNINEIQSTEIINIFNSFILNDSLKKIK